MALRPDQNPASIALFDSTFSNAPMIFFVAERSDKGTLLYITPNIDRLLGYTARTLLGNPLFSRKLIHPGDAGQLPDSLNNIAESGLQIYEYRFLAANGQYRWLRDEIELVRPQDGSAAYLQGYRHDISAQKAKEATLVENIDNLQAIVNSLPQHLLWKDRNSVFRGCNLAAAREIGLERCGDIVGKSDFDFHANRADAEYLRDIDETVMATGHASYHADVPGKFADTWLDVTKVPLRDADGKVYGLLISYEDVSEHRRNRFALSNFRRAVEQSSSAIFITNLNGEIEYVNPRFLQLYGYTEHDVLSKNARLLKSGNTPSSTYADLWKTITSGKSWHGELQNRGSKGQLCWQSISISPIFDDEGGFSHFLSIEDDITLRKQLEIDLKRQLSFTQILINALPHPVYFKDKHGRFRGCNLAMEKALGLAPGGIAGKSVFDIAPPEIAQTYHEMDNKLFANPGTQAYETRMLHHDGTLHDVLSHKATYLDEHGNVAGIIGSIIDISERKRIEEAIRLSEQRFRTIANYTYNWENWVDTKGKLLWVNPGVEHITGYSAEECLAMTDFPVPLIHPDDWPAASAHYAATVAGAPNRTQEFRILRKNGGIRWAEVVVQQVYDENGNSLGHRSSLSDVTERRLAMDELHSTRDMLKMVLDHIPQGVFWKDINGRYLGANDIFVRDLALAAGWEKKGVTDFDLFPVAEAKKFRRDDQKIIRNNKAYTSFEEQFTDSEGIRRWALTSKVPLHDRQGKVIGVLGSYADMTEMKQLNADLRDSEARLREITTTAAEGILVLDHAGEVSFVNPEAEHLLGWNESELLGKTELLFADAVQDGALDADTGEKTRLIYKTTFAATAYSSDDILFRRKNGTTFDASIRATPIIRNSQYAGAVVAFHDISEQKRTQRLLQNALKEVKIINASLEQRVKTQTEDNIEKERLLIQQSRSAAMGEMISNIAHQWRQPLSTLGLVVQNIHLDYRDKRLTGEELDNYVSTANQCVTRMSETIDDFRDFFRPDKARVHFNLSEAINDTLKLLGATLKNNNIMVNLSTDNTLRVFGHFNEFSQVILNLLANAKEALVESRQKLRRIDIELRTDEHAVLTVIRDNAGGIPENLLDKIFDPYFTTKAGGSGIGLYMSKTIIEKHMGGSISCHNNGDGAEFTISIPLKSSDIIFPE